MTSISTFSDFLEELEELRQSKEHPDEWYVLTGRQVGAYSVHDAERPDELPEQSDLPPEERDATESVDGFYQIGAQGWSADAFVDDVNFVAEVSFSDSYDMIDKRANGILLVHESCLSDEALEIARGDDDAEEVTA